ncbi:MAG TPA: MBL fold metallo-hydrolase [Pyrinomonadaceae bacterium]|jgi:glyoxylase-like metal-dependent hydrolase (beta-lactamase superfamily II)|nr:MBL fold metallo-hydrolase [Pyrinomonadaceae bacterium]
MNAIGLWFFAATTLMAQNQDYSKVEIKVTKVAGTVYMLQGAGGNIAASIGEDGIVVVDDQFAPLAAKIEAALRGVTDKPVRFIINTHYHIDHTGGNAWFQKQAPIIAHDNVRKRLEQGSVAGNGSTKDVQAPASGDALPIFTFDHDVTVHLNGEDIRALHFPSGHTDGDSIIFFLKSNVVHMGDDFVTYGFPFVDLESGGSVQGMITATDEVAAALPPDAKVIPGHGPLSSLDELRQFTKMLKDTQRLVQAGIKQGKSLEQMQKENILGPWQKYSGEFVTSEQWLITLYNDLTGNKSGELIKHN